MLLCTMLACAQAHSHGGVFLEDDLCLIQVGFYKAHFTIYQPQTSQHKEFCEDVPHANETVFVMEYLHASLKEMSVDFRIINDVLGRGRFFREEDLKKIDDINRVTEFYQAPSVQQDGVFLALHQFQGEGNYVGVVTVNVRNDEKSHIAVFPFRVGGRKWGYIPLFITTAILLQLNYWLISGGYARIRKMLKLPAPTNKNKD